MVSLLIEVHDYMERQNEEDTMPLFNDIEDNVEEIEINEEQATEPVTEFDQINGNATTFLYMMEDYTKQRISKNEMFIALHILRDSIDSYLDSSDVNEHGTEQREQTESTEE